jgi:single-strand selective monofunctional uracil DNA glycosylase
MATSDLLIRAARKLSANADKLTFASPVAHVYNPLGYARRAHEIYLRRYGDNTKRVIFLGMNPGPFGMAQTGVPFGEIRAVRDWLGIETAVGKPPREHPKRPIDGFACARSEVSGARVWGALQSRYGKPEKFFAHNFISNYCPLVFMEDSGRNRTPDKLAPAERAPLFTACDRYLNALVDVLAPEYVIGIGKFAQERAQAALAQRDLRVGVVPHPSPANPAANRGWLPLVDAALHELGLKL